ncbi:hypothetical protein [Alcanivorax sp.]|uniref:hypothetical protein n=1 Tax=Alcanivorax sp. TaxID=1872427 RepID=UPI002588F366|nr:hypothetical protein [Alcanivorax sp.]
MDDSSSGNDLLDAIKYTTSERLKATQRKLSTARNTLVETALSRPYRGFFSDEEQEVLSRAAAILGDFKRKVEHAKEIKAREEKRRDAHIERCRALRAKILREAFPQPVDTEQHMEAVIFQLALCEFRSEVSRSWDLFNEIGQLEEDLAQALDSKFPNLKVAYIAPRCHRETTDWLDERLWYHDDIPESQKLSEIMASYETRWRSVIVTKHQDFLQRYKDALDSEFAEVKAKARERNALARRSEFKAIK